MHIEIHYPKEDLVWIAKDQFGNWAVFVTAGVACVPEEICDQPLFLSKFEQELLKLPKISDIKMFVDGIPDDSSFRALAERGFYVYDWQDVHRVAAEELGGYEKVCEPTQSISELQMQSLSTTLDWPRCKYSFHNLSIVDVNKDLVRKICSNK